MWEEGGGWGIPKECFLPIVEWGSVVESELRAEHFDLGHTLCRSTHCSGHSYQYLQSVHQRALTSAISGLCIWHKRARKGNTAIELVETQLARTPHVAHGVLAAAEEDSSYFL